MRPLLRLAPLLLLAALLLLTGASVVAPRGPVTAVPKPGAPRVDVSDFEKGADSNGTWPAGWQRSGNQPTARIERVTPGRSGGEAVLLSSKLRNGYVGVMRQLPDSLRTETVAVRLIAWIRTERAESTSAWIHLTTTSGMISSDETAIRWPKGDTNWTRYEILLPVLPEVQRVTFGFRLAGGGSMWVDDVALEALRPEETPSSSPRAIAYLDAALDSICMRTVLTAKLNWGVLKRAARTQMVGGHEPADAYGALRYALHRLDDFAELHPPEKPGLVGLAKNFALLNHLDTLSNVGIIRLPMCDSGDRATQLAFADTTRSVIARLGSKGLRGWMVDLRVVSGGEVMPALAGVAPLLGDGTLVGWIRPDGRRGRWTHHQGVVEADPGSSPERTLVTVVAPALADTSTAVAVLIGPRTHGAGEALALAFRSRPNTRFFGGPTAGLPYARERVRLSDGAQLQFATASLTDRTGRIQDGSIMPDDSLDAGLLTGGMDATMIAALNWLKDRPAAGR